MQAHGVFHPFHFLLGDQDFSPSLITLASSLSRIMVRRPTFVRFSLP